MFCRGLVTVYITHIILSLLAEETILHFLVWKYTSLHKDSKKSTMLHLFFSQKSIYEKTDMFKIIPEPYLCKMLLPFAAPVIYRG